MTTCRLVVAVLCASMVVAGTAAAQPAPYNELGLTMGHWHIASTNVEAHSHARQPFDCDSAGRDSGSGQPRCGKHVSLPSRRH